MPPDDRRLRTALESEITETRALLAILEEERQALEANRHDGLIETSARKQACLERIEKVAATRISMLAAQGLTSDRMGMETCLARLDPSDRNGLQRLWRELHGLLTACHRLNRVNSQVVQTRLQTSRQTLDLLHGRTPGTVQEYTPDGRTLAGTAIARTLVSA